MLYWLVSIAALAGVVLNIKKHVACFYVWAFTNAVWVFADLEHGLHAQAALMAVYFALSIYGIRKWSRGKGASHGEETSN
jgi:nicotinamide mononucleotide transporter